MEREELKELRQHGDPMFPFCVYRLDLTAGHTVVNYHWHEEAEIVYFTKGTATILINTTLYNVHAGQAVFLNGEDIHSIYSLDSIPSECCAMVFNLDLLSSGRYDQIQHKFIAPLLEKRVRFPHLLTGENQWEQSVLSHLNEIVQAFETQPPAYELLIKSRLYLILTEYVAHDQLYTTERMDALLEKNRDRLKAVFAYVESHYTERILLKDLAEQAYMSEGHFCRFFKSVIGKTPVEYINEYRVNRASKLLQTTKRSIMEVALAVGFENLSYFIKVFRRYKRCSPSEYRRRYGEVSSR